MAAKPSAAKASQEVTGRGHEPPRGETGGVARRRRGRSPVRPRASGTWPSEARGWPCQRPLHENANGPPAPFVWGDTQAQSVNLLPVRRFVSPGRAIWLGVFSQADSVPLIWVTTSLTRYVASAVCHITAASTI